MRKSWWACVLQGKMLLHTDLSSRLWWLFMGRDSFFPGLLLGKSRVYLIQEVSHFYCYKVTLKKRFSCVIQLLLVTEIMSNSICISLESSWAIFLFITMKRDRLPQVGNPRAAIKLLWNISVHPCGHWEEVDPKFSWSDWCSSYNCTPFVPDPSPALRESLTVFS